ncbi:MAG: hypothetical protein MJ154_01700 [Candidatus Saccharibacteria bacterium]|nr:hypothetical protein [Candidatus Saccharibacteria bacterium]
MYEISLVPDVKSELIKKLKLRNFVFLICVIVAASCGGVFAILLSITGGQGLALAAKDEEMACRSEGSIPKSSKRCDSKYGTAIMKFRNESEILTIQDQMKNLSLLNANKIKFSRVFNILDTILPNQAKGDENTVKISEINTNINNDTLFFDALGYSNNNIGYRALEAFKKNASLSYFDYGNYMRKDSESGEYVPIPSFCIDEQVVNGITYGIYHKGQPGCEAPMVEEEDTKINNILDNMLEDDLSNQITENAEAETKKVEKKDIRIRRTYNDVSDREKYMEGNDRFASKTDEKIKGYYFESKCLQYDEDGKFDENSTKETCPLLSEEPYIGDSAYGRDSDDIMVLSFSSSLKITHSVFLSSNKHMMIVGPTRKNVTDSYIQISGMFTEAAHDTEEVK